METNKLMLNNFVHLENNNDKLFKIIEIKENNVRVEYLREDTNQLHRSLIEIDRIKPIKINTDMLIKLGFKFNDEIFVYTKNRVVITSTFVLLLGSMSFTIQYLHELQNMYYLLTNVKLKVEL